MSCDVVCLWVVKRDIYRPINCQKVWIIIIVKDMMNVRKNTEY